MTKDKMQGISEEYYDFDEDVEHSPEFTERILKKGKKLLEETNPELLELMEKLKNKN